MLRKALCSLAVLSVVSMAAFAQQDGQAQQKSERQQKQQKSERKQQSERKQSGPYQKANSSWITLNGTVVSSKPDSFVLDYGEGVITVEMDDWDWYREGSQLSDGDKVSVTGRIDDDLLEQRSIEASSVFVDDLNTYYFASASDEEQLDPYFISTTYYLQPLGDESNLSLTGTVAQVNGREFILDTGAQQIQVDTSTMGYNPLDKQGFQRISKGDRVSVSGELDLDFFEQREILADSIISLNRDAGKSKSQSGG